MFLNALCVLMRCFVLAVGKKKRHHNYSIFFIIIIISSFIALVYHCEYYIIWSEKESKDEGVERE